MPRAKACGVPVLLRKEQIYGGGKYVPGLREMGRYAAIGKASATKLVKSLFGHTRLPRMGNEMKLCEDQWLENVSGKFNVVRYAPGQFAGTRPRRRRR